MKNFMKKATAAVLVLTLIMTMNVSVFALGDEAAAGGDSSAPAAEEQKPEAATAPETTATPETTAEPEASGTETVKTEGGSQPADEAKAAGEESDTIKNGIYKPSSFNVSGGSSKVKITCPSVKITDGKATAKLVFSSDKYTKLKTGGRTYTGYCDGGVSTYYVPVEINKDYVIVGTTTAMSVPKEISYTINIQVKSDSEAAEEPGFANPGTNPLDPGSESGSVILNNIYKPSSFNFEGGTGRVKITCPSVKITDGKAMAKLVFNSDKYSKLKIGDKTYKGYCGDGESTYYVPVEINKDFKIIGVTTAMGAPKEIEYTINIQVGSDSGTAEEPGFADPGMNEIIDDPGTVTPVEPEPAEPAPGVSLKDGTYLVKVKTDERMFHIQPYNGKTVAKVTKSGKTITATITLTGQGYDYLYMGTAAQAAKAAGNGWHKYSESKGYYSYTFKISQFDKTLPIAARSKKYSKWYDHTIIFYSKGAVKTSAGTSIIPKKENVVKPTRKLKSTNMNPGAVDNSTKLKDGTYKADKFSWSGGTGRLAYIKCTGITVKNGKAYAKIVFSSSSYDKVKAGGKTISKSGGGFTIPVKLNSNNTVVGRTTAMSSPHWIAYSVFIYSNAAAKAGDGKSAGAGGEISPNKLADKQPAIPGLESQGEVKVEKAKYFKIFNYEKDVRLIQVDIMSGSGLKYSTKDKTEAEKVEYDEDGKPIAKTQNEIVEGLYHHKVVNYLVVPDGVEIPAGLDKECIILDGTEISSQIASNDTEEMLKKIGVEDKVAVTSIKADKNSDNYVGSYEEPVFAKIINEKVNLNILPSEAVPGKKAGKEKTKTLELIEKRYSTIEVPILFDRSQSEKDELAKAEWIKVFGSVFDKQDEAEKYFDSLSDGKKVDDEK